MRAWFSVNIAILKIRIRMSDKRIGPFHTVLFLMIDAQIKLSGMIVLNPVIDGHPIGPAEMFLIASTAADVMSGKIIHKVIACLFCV